MWPFKAKTIESPPHLQDTGDWSLRANGETYRDRQKESEVLINRLKRSTASVTGIAGQRGAGKSSLALRILSEADKQGAFTLLIHSPTGYDPKEFLISLFQRICEEVTQKVSHKFGEADSLSERGHSIERRLRGAFWAIIIGFLFVFVTTTTYTYYQYDQTKQELESDKIKSELASISAREKRLQDSFDTLSAGTSRTNEQEMKLENVTDELKYIRGKQEDLKKYGTRRRKSVTSSTLFTFGPLMLVTYGLMFLLFRIIQRLRLKIRIVQKHPEEAGLRNLAIDLLEHLQYQTSLSKKSEANISLLKVATKFSSGKELSARPISLPGLTAELATFLQRISEVYCNSVVICLDELDKIENPNELDELLRGIKGILGQKNTHFLLTVSEDALVKFTTRRRMDRGMLESAFEDIVLLKRVDLETAKYMLSLMYPEEYRKTSDVGIENSTLLFWIFGSGIPREIKRNALSTLEEGIFPSHVKGHDLWLQLFYGRLETIKSWAGRTGRDDKITYRFLRQLDNSIKSLKKTTTTKTNLTEWYCNFIKEWRDFSQDNFNYLVTDKDGKSCVPSNSSDIELEYSLARAMLEILVGASGLNFVNEKFDKTITQERIKQLQEIFDFIPTNVTYASDLCWEYLATIEVTTNTVFKQEK